MIKRILTTAFGLSIALLASNASATVDEYALKAAEQPSQPSTHAPADIESYNGTTVGANEWTRPYADGTCCSGLGPVRYTVQEFHVSANDTCNVRSVQEGWDGYLFVYSTAFDPLAQTVNFVAGDDDGNGGIGTSDIEGIALSANTTYFAVTTGFQNGEEGTFTNSIECQAADVTLGAVAPRQPVPANAPRALIALIVLAGVLGAMALRSRTH